MKQTLKYALIRTPEAKGAHVQSRHGGILGHQTGQHWYIMMHDTTEDVIDYVIITGTHGPIHAAIDGTMLTLIEMEEHGFEITSQPKSTV